MKCPCSMKPPNLKIIKVGESEVGLLDLNRILRDVYFLRLTDEARIKEELWRRVVEKNSLAEGRRELYVEALWREYRKFAGRVGKREAVSQKNGAGEKKKQAKGLVKFFKRLFK